MQATTSTHATARQRLVIALVLLCVSPQVASAQISRVKPGQSYFATIETLYDAQYTRAARGFQGELRGAIRTANTRWIDSICYYTMLGESLYLQGAYGPALEQFDRSAELFLANATWLQRVKFQQTPRVDTTLARQQPAWARPQRAVVYAHMPESFLFAIGQIDNKTPSQQGGVVRAAQFWKIDAQELARTIAWTIYRRGKILGPLAKHDPLQRALSDTLSRGGVGLTNHWSNTWVELWWGLAAASTGDTAQALPHLQRALALEGRYDHALTGLAALVQGELALAAGEPSASGLLVEAVNAAVAYDDLGVLTEAMANLHLLPGAPAPLFDNVGAWSSRGGIHHVTIAAGLAAAEASLNLGDNAGAANRLKGLFGRHREAESGLLGIAAARLHALLEAKAGNAEKAMQTIQRAMQAQAGVSLRNFRIGLATARFDSGELSPRLTRAVFAELLGDPSAFDWRENPIDCLTTLRTDHSPSLDRWFAAALSRREMEESIDIAELTRRHRYFAAQPLGGRLASLRRLLTAPDETLVAEQRVARNALITTWPVYVTAHQNGLEAQRTLGDTDGLLGEKGSTPVARRATATYEKTVAHREQLLLEMALSRYFTPLVYPPPITAKETKKQLQPGQVVFATHETQGEMYGIVLTSAGEHVWLIGKQRQLRKKIIALLHEVAGVSAQQTRTFEELASDFWRGPAAELGQMLFDKSRLDWSSTTELIVVPDGLMWHCPLETVLIGSPGEESKTLLEVCQLRYAPTVGMALMPKKPKSSRSLLAIVGPAPDEDAPADPIMAIDADAVRIAPPQSPSPAIIKTLVDRLVVDQERILNPAEPLQVSLLPTSRRSSSNLFEWATLPYTGPRVVTLSKLHTSAERLLKSGRGSKKGTLRQGDELFYAACALLAPGTETVLLSRWTTNGARDRDLVAEFLIGLSSVTPSEAWRRSVRLAQPTPLTVDHEPRVEPPDNKGLASPPDATHPFFWAGYLLLN